MNPLSDFTLFYPWTMSTRDWANWSNSLVRRVMLPWSLYNDKDLKDVMDRFASYKRTDKAGVQHPIHFVFRLTPEDLNIDVGTLQGQLTHRKGLGHPIDAIILGVEPELHFSFEWSAPDPEGWGNQPLYGQPSPVSVHVEQTARVFDALSDQGVKLISPGWSNRPFHEFDPYQPGLATWRELTHPVLYNEMDGMGVHIYQDMWEYPVDTLRFCFSLRMWGMLCHKPMWIDEFNVSHGNNVYRMRACIGAADLLVQHLNLGSRVEMFCPFTSNGLPNAYDAGLVMNEPEAYLAVRDFMLRHDHSKEA